MKNVAWMLVPGSFNFQGVLCKKEYEEANMLICPILIVLLLNTQYKKIFSNI